MVECVRVSVCVYKNLLFPYRKDHKTESWNTLTKTTIDAISKHSSSSSSTNNNATSHSVIQPPSFSFPRSLRLPTSLPAYHSLVHLLIFYFCCRSNYNSDHLLIPPTPLRQPGRALSFTNPFESASSFVSYQFPASCVH